MLLDAGAKAGFRGVSIRPNFLDKSGMVGAKEYVRELGFSEKAVSKFLDVYKRYSEVYFESIQPEDRSGMYICIFEK